MLPRSQHSPPQLLESVEDDLDVADGRGDAHAAEATIGGDVLDEDVVEIEDRAASLDTDLRRGDNVGGQELAACVVVNRPTISGPDGIDEWTEPTWCRGRESNPQGPKARGILRTRERGSE
jgi:hypothetical protein